MANKNINNTNLVIGPNTRVEKGEIKQLEINGEDIPLANGVQVVSGEQTIDVSAYTEPVVVTAPSGKYFDKVTVTLANVIDHLYAWKNEDGTDPIYAYTTTTTPAVGDNAIMPDAATLALITDPIATIGTDTITAFMTEFERDDTKDIEL